MSVAALRVASSFSATRSASHAPMAGALVRPGDSTPSALKKPGASGASPSTKSLTVVSCARSPLNSVITLLSGRPGYVRRAPAFAFSRPSYVVALSSLSGMSSAVGPTITVPSTVGETRMPLPIFDGTWNIVAEKLPSSSRSSMRYSPRRAWMLYFVALTRLLSSSEWMPAQLISVFAVNTRPSSHVTRQTSSVRSSAVTRASKMNETPFAAAFSAARNVSW